VKDVPIPFNLSKNDRDRRGLPIPFIVYRDQNGVPHFTVDDRQTVNLVLSKKLCGLCGKPLKLGQMWFIAGPVTAFHEDGLSIEPHAHEECARYAVQVCAFLAAPNYSRRIEDKTLDLEDVHDNAQVHKSHQAPPRPVFFALARTSGIKVIDAGDGSDLKYIQPRRPWKEVEFWQNGERIAQSKAEQIAQANDLPPSQLKWWP
jgi:hypothetical protein